MLCKRKREGGREGEGIWMMVKHNAGSWLDGLISFWGRESFVFTVVSRYRTSP